MLILFVVILLHSIAESLPEKQTDGESTIYKCNYDLLNQTQLYTEDLETMHEIQRLNLDPLNANMDRNYLNALIKDAKIMLKEFINICSMLDMLDNNTNLHGTKQIIAFEQIQKDLLKNLMSVVEMQQNHLKDSEKILMEMQKLQQDFFKLSPNDFQYDKKKNMLLNTLEKLKKQNALGQHFSTELKVEFQSTKDEQKQNVCQIFKLLRKIGDNESTDETETNTEAAINTNPTNPTDIVQLLHNDTELQKNFIDEKFTQQRLLLRNEFENFQKNLNETFRNSLNSTNGKCEGKRFWIWRYKDSNTTEIRTTN